MFFCRLPLFTITQDQNLRADSISLAFTDTHSVSVKKKYQTKETLIRMQTDEVNTSNRALYFQYFI